MEVAALIISIVSIVGTLGISIYEIINSIRVNDINLEAELSVDTFKKYLTLKIPNAVSNISFDNNKLSNIQELQDVLNDFRKELRFYQYCDKDFFDEFKISAQDVEDYIVSNEGKSYESTDFADVNSEIINKLKKVYEVCQKKYKRG